MVEPQRSKIRFLTLAASQVDKAKGRRLVTEALYSGDRSCSAMTCAGCENSESENERVFTDGAFAYTEGIRRTFQNRPEHIARAGIKPKPHANNNRVRRLNGTLRERVKVQRGWKSTKTQLAEGQRIQYNFVKPHAALDGQTPAQVAGIGIDAESKWMELLRKAIDNKAAKC